MYVCYCISGQKGIGFKSVFRVSDCPEVHSNGYHIRFDAKSGPIGYILPEWIGDKCPEEQTGEDVEDGIGDMENEDNDDGVSSTGEKFNRLIRASSTEYMYVIIWVSVMILPFSSLAGRLVSSCH